MAKKALPHLEAAQAHATKASRNSAAWKSWREGDGWRKWNQAIAPAVAARRRLLEMLGDKAAVRLLFDVVAPRYVSRPGGYTRVLRLATPRLGDAGTRAILEFVGKHDRVSQAAERPTFAGEAGKA